MIQMFLFLIASGTTVNLAINVLKEHGVSLSNIILLTLFATPNGIKSVISAHPDITIITTEIQPISPNDFGQRYFGTE
jgi:uracil phosphoribosyltransferase